MLDKFKQLLLSSGSRGPRPSDLCLWHDLHGLNQLAKELATESAAISDWEALRQKLKTSQGQD